MPPHRGHEFLVSFARHYVHKLYVVVGTLPGEPIPGTLRWQWMKELFTECEVLHLHQVLPQAPEEAVDFWDQWEQALKNLLPEPVQCVFASESYGEPLAQVLNARFIPLDLPRQVVPISATQIRAEPFKHWEYLPAVVRPYFARRICVVGPECSGKTTLTRALAKYYDTVYAPEYAELWLRYRSNYGVEAGALFPEHFETIARGQRALEQSRVKHCHRLLFCDTDPLTTLAWATYLCPPEHHAALQMTLEPLIKACEYELYFYCTPDIPWQADQHRLDPEGRERFGDHLRHLLQKYNRSVNVLSGNLDSRLAAAKQAIDAVLL